MTDDLSMWEREDLEEMVREQRKNIKLLYAEKRDQFAMAALTGLLAGRSSIERTSYGPVSYEFADAMMEARALGEKE